MKKLIMITCVICALTLLVACGDKPSAMDNALADIVASGETDETEDAAEIAREIDPAELMGKYDLVRVQRGDLELSGEDLSIRNMQNDYIYLLENNEVEIMLNDVLFPVHEMEHSGGYDQGKIETEILNFDYSIEGGEVILTEIDREESYIFTRSSDEERSNQSLDAEFVAPYEGGIETRFTKYLDIPSRWAGVFTIADGLPEGEWTEGEFEATAIIGVSDVTGLPYMTIWADYQGAEYVVSSFDMELMDNTFYPVYNGEGSINGQLLDPETSISYVPTMKNGVLNATYLYVDGDYSATLSYSLARMSLLEERVENKRDGVEPPAGDDSIHTDEELVELFSTFNFHGKTKEDAIEFYGGIMPETINYSADYQSFKFVSAEDEGNYIVYGMEDVDGRKLITGAEVWRLLPDEEANAIIDGFSQSE